MKKKTAIALRLMLVLSLLPVSITSAPSANAATAESILCASKNVNNGANVDISYIPGYCVLKFKSGTVTWTVPSTVTYIDYLVVAGGGAGGRGSNIGCEAGGGGAGGVLNGSMSIAPSSQHAITIGEGGTTNASRVPGSGGDTTAFALTAKGGGFGGTSDLNSAAGGSGGSGGGGAHNKGGGGNRTSGQGTSGEQPINGSSGGGGGGATTSGIRGFGGTGLASAITGTTVYYGDGGAGSNTYISNPPYPSITAGSYQSLRGGSGNGGLGPASVGATPGNGAANTGSGGAGAYYCDNTVAGGNGGSGVVIVRYPVKPSVNGLEAYFRNDSTNGTSAIRNPVTTGPEFCHYGVYSNVNTDWGSSNPRSTASGDYTYDPSSPSSCNNDYFHGFYTGFIKTPAVSGTYSFRINADDHVILDIDSATVISNASGAVGSVSGTVSLQANTVYPIQINFQESTGGAAIFMFWTPPGGTEEFVPSANLGTTVGALQSGSQLNSVCSIGLSSACPAYSPQEIRNIYGSQSNGTFWLYVNGVASNVYIMMDSGFDGGGYVLAMKGANNATTFNYDANYWTRPNVLNTTGSTFLSRNTTDNTDAKFNAFNYLPPSSIVAVFPQENSTNFTAGALGSNGTYGFSWRETMTANANSYLGIFTDTTTHYEVLLGSMYSKQVSRQLLREATDKDIGKHSSNNTSIFTRQANVKFFGFNYRQQDWLASGNTNKARWGFGNNENGVNSDYEIERTNDAIGGIGVSGDATYSAGDYYNSSNNVTQTGINRATKFEMYLKMADPNLAAPSNLTSSTAGNGNITLRWSKPANTIPSEYVIQYRTSGAADWSAANSSSLRLLMPSDSATPTTVISGLSRTTKYEFRVFARSSYNLVSNNSSPSSTSTLTRLDMPTNVKVMPVSDTDTALAVTFTGTVGAAKHFVQVFSNETASVQVGSTWDTFTSGTRITGLTRNSRYFITVTAANASGDGNSSPTTVIKGVTPGFADWTLKTNTGEYARALDDSTLDFNGDMTMQAWVYPTGNSGANANTVFNKDHSYQLSHVNGFWRYGFYNSSDATTVVDTGVPVRYDEWHHIAVTRQASNGTVLFYQDGVLLQTNTTTGVFTGAIRNSSFPLGLGARIPDGSGVSNEFIGRIDQIKLFSSVRTASEILNTDMTTYGAVDTSNLVAFYDFNEGDGTTIFNRAQGSPVNTDALVLGTPQWRTLEDVDVQTLGAYTVTTFKRTYFTLSSGWKVPNGVSRVQTLLVAGGGGGGGGLNGGGGGAGGFIETITSISSSTSYSITVGMGGNGWMSSPRTLPTNGKNSSAFSLTAIGGGFGGVEDYATAGIHYAPNSGGSGGGGGWGQTAGYRSGALGTTGQGNRGGSNLDYCCTAAGGGGAGGVGVNTSSTKAGDGGPGRLSAITGTTLGGGGGGASRNVGVNLRGVGGSGGGGTAGSTNGGNGDYGSANTGGGGGGAWASDGNSGRAGDGGSGIIVIRWITATAPSFTAPAAIDTTTAGKEYKFTIGGTATTPLTRNYRWQWTNGTSDTWGNYTTSDTSTLTLTSPETMTSGANYKYRVIVTDSDTAGLSISDTSTSFYLIINPRNTITSSTGSAIFTQKYGETRTAIFTFAFGTGTRTSSVLTTENNQNGRIAWSNLNGDSATVRVGTGLPAGTYYETLTVTDSVTAFTSQGISITVSKADTITVTSTLSSSRVTYNEENRSALVSSTISGLVNSETGTVTNIFLSSSDAQYSTNCATGGTCKVGDLAPGGGYVFYVSDTIINSATGISNGGIYLATAPTNWQTGTTGDPLTTWGCQTNVANTLPQVGSGAENTRLIVAAQSGCSSSTVAAKVAADLSITSSGTTYSDWFAPSEAEIALMYANVRSIASISSKLYWSSTQSYDVSGLNNSYYGRAYGFTNDARYYGSGCDLNIPCNVLKANSGSHISSRPIRAFSPANLSTATDPINVGIYLVTPTLTLSSPASLSNYQAVAYTSSILAIDQARQKALSIGQYEAYPNISSYPLNVYGGSGPGALTVSMLAAETNTAGCSLSASRVITATSVGTCRVQAVKAGTRNYLAETTTATITWIAWSANNAVQSLGGNHSIPLVGGNQVIVRTETVTASAFSDINGNAITSASRGAVIRINSAGFAGLTTSDIYVTFRPYEDAVVRAVTSTYVEVEVPPGATTGVISIDSPRGVAYTQSFTISP